MIDEADAVARLGAGEVVALPTDTVYGLCVAATVAGATARLFEVKERPASVALPVLVADSEDAAELGEFNQAARKLLTAHWPGPLTIVVARTDASLGWDLGGEPATIGLRCPNEETLRRIARAVGPLAVSSANVHGHPPCTTAAEVEGAFGAAFPVVDGGRRAAIPSTVVDCTGDQVRTLRRGVVVVDG